MDPGEVLSEPGRLPAIARALRESTAPFSLVDLAAESLPPGIPEIAFDQFAAADGIAGDLDAWFCSEVIEAIEALGWVLCVDFGAGPVLWTRPANFAALTT